MTRRYVPACAIDTTHLYNLRHGADEPSRQVFVWPGVTQKSLTAKPFHIYDDEFYDVIGSDPSLTLIATSDTDPIFHEAVVW